MYKYWDRHPIQSNILLTILFLTVIPILFITEIVLGVYLSVKKQSTEVGRMYIKEYKKSWRSLK